MGYESKLYVVDTSAGDYNLPQNGLKYARIITMFDVCCFPAVSDMFREKKQTGYFICIGDDDILEDKYGDALYFAELQDVIDVIEKEVEKGENYRRAKPLLAALKVYEKQRKNGEWKDIKILHYGY